jgi:hypothetical protein
LTAHTTSWHTAHSTAPRSPFCRRGCQIQTHATTPGLDTWHNATSTPPSEPGSTLHLKYGRPREQFSLNSPRGSNAGSSFAREHFPTVPRTPLILEPVISHKLGDFTLTPPLPQSHFVNLLHLASFPATPTFCTHFPRSELVRIPYPILWRMCHFRGVTSQAWVVCSQGVVSEFTSLSAGGLTWHSLG